jgi:hypothetical protein
MKMAMVHFQVANGEPFTVPDGWEIEAVREMSRDSVTGQWDISLFLSEEVPDPQAEALMALSSMVETIEARTGTAVEDLTLLEASAMLRILNELRKPKMQAEDPYAGAEVIEVTSPTPTLMQRLFDEAAKD